MRKLSLCFLIFYILFFISAKSSFATYDPLSVKNNIFGIHILFPSEVSEASTLVNSSGGDWGYVTIPIQASDRDLVKWQTFMDDCRKYHLIPIIRIATVGDYFNQGSWSQPSDNDVLDFANFLNSLNWPTKNRYVIIFNEPNRGDEWGGTPDASSYAQILDYAAHIFKQTNPDFFVISAGLDNASANVLGKSIDDYTFMYEMNNAVPGIFSEIDGMASHSYPNPGFSAPPSASREGIDSFYYQEQLADSLSGKSLPVFITETGWSSDSVPYGLQAEYYNTAFKDYWNDPSIVAVTPFIFHSEQGPFNQFSFIKNNSKTDLYNSYQNLHKIGGEPQLTPNYSYSTQTAPQSNLPVKKFNNTYQIESIFKTINSSSKEFFKWLLKI